MNQLNDCCRIGNIEKLKSLLNDNPNINIHENEEWAFALGCYYGHIEFIKFLLNISQKYSGKKINIHIDKDYIAKIVYIKGNINILHFLIKISQKYSGKQININQKFRSSEKTLTMCQFMKSLGNYFEIPNCEIIIL